MRQEYAFISIRNIIIYIFYEVRISRQFKKYISKYHPTSDIIIIKIHFQYLKSYQILFRMKR